MIKTVIKRICLSLGYEVSRISIGKNAFRDMKSLTGKSRNLVVFDVGANEGQTISEFRRHLERLTIHAFEPGDAFSELEKRTAGIPDLHLNNFALGENLGKWI